MCNKTRITTTNYMGILRCAYSEGHTASCFSETSASGAKVSQASKPNSRDKGRSEEQAHELGERLERGFKEKRGGGASFGGPVWCTCTFPQTQVPDPHHPHRSNASAGSTSQEKGSGGKPAGGRTQKPRILPRSEEEEGEEGGKKKREREEEDGEKPAEAKLGPKRQRRRGEREKSEEGREEDAK